MGSPIQRRLMGWAVVVPSRPFFILFENPKGKENFMLIWALVLV